MPEIPFAFQWPFQEKRLLPLKDSANGYLRSASVTSIPEFEYFLSIYPNGDDDESRGETWIFLHMKLKNVKKVETDNTFTIESANYTETGHNIYGKTGGWGAYVCKTDELFDPEKQYVIDGKFTLKISGVFKYNTEDAPDLIDEQKWIGGELGDDSWINDDKKDFVIAVEGKEIKVHKLVLDIRSEVFAAMFNSNMKETEENKMAITDFSFNVVEAALKIIYDCNFTTTLSLNELMQLLQFFDKYQLPTLKDKVEPHLIDQISATTVCRLANCSILTNSFKLKEKCMEILSAAFASKTPLLDFKTLDKDIAFEVLENSFHQIVETED